MTRSRRADACARHAVPSVAAVPPPSVRNTFFPVTNGKPSLPDVLVVRFSAIGDILLTTPLLRAIRLRHPGRADRRAHQGAVRPAAQRQSARERGVRDRGERRRSVRSRSRSGASTTVTSSTCTAICGRHALRPLAPGPLDQLLASASIARAAFITTKRDLYGEDRAGRGAVLRGRGQLDVWPDGAPPDFFLAHGVEEEVEARLEKLGRRAAARRHRPRRGARHQALAHRSLGRAGQGAPEDRGRGRRGRGADDAKLAQWIATDAGPGAASVAGLSACRRPAP